MIFELTDSLAEKILFAMENQDDEFVLDAGSGEVLPASGIDESAAGENICSLPSWSSNDGYNVLETFAARLRSPVIQRELRGVLAGGRGVFRNFKQTLKKYPEIERRFQRFKANAMKARLMEWYNSLRESWGLEKLGTEPEDSGDLLLSDFVFRGYDSRRDRESIAQCAGEIGQEVREEFPGELGLALGGVWLRWSAFEPGRADGIVCRTLLDDFAGCLLYERPSRTEETAVLAACFVHQNYRGLGIARELFARCIRLLRERGFRFFVIADSLVPKETEAMLSRLGFEKNRLAFVADVKQG